MHGEIEEIFKPFKFLGIIGFIIFILTFMFAINMNSNYEKNYFDIKLNSVPMKCYYDEKYTNAFFIKAGTSGYNNIESRINRVELVQPIILDINEYEVYYKNGDRKSMSGWTYNEKYNYQEVYNNINIQIKRMNNIIYEGEYIRDLSDYIKEAGRYYIHIYITRKDSMFEKVKTHITFNVIVGGGNNA